MSQIIESDATIKVTQGGSYSVYWGRVSFISGV